MVNFNTFSITARCEKTKQLGVAVSTAIPGVGWLVPYVKAGVGAIASQAFVNPYLGINGLAYLEEGLTAEATLEKVIAEDPAAELRQVSIVDAAGNAVVYTGSKCDSWHGHITGDNYAIAGNMLANTSVLKAMETSFNEQGTLDLAERLLRALEAGQAAGGDKRGKQSASLYVVDTEAYPLIDVRVDEHKDPVTELRRIYTVMEKRLVPFVKMLPTKKHPAGKLDVKRSEHA